MSVLGDVVGMSVGAGKSGGGSDSGSKRENPIDALKKKRGGSSSGGGVSTDAMSIYDRFKKRGSKQRD